MINYILMKLGLCKLKTAKGLRRDGERLMRMNACLSTKILRLESEIKKLK